MHTYQAKTGIRRERATKLNLSFKLICFTDRFSEVRTNKLKPSRKQNTQYYSWLCKCYSLIFCTKNATLDIRNFLISSVRDLPHRAERKTGRFSFIVALALSLCCRMNWSTLHSELYMPWEVWRIVKYKHSSL